MIWQQVIVLVGCKLYKFKFVVIGFFTAAIFVVAVCGSQFIGLFWVKMCGHFSIGRICSVLAGRAVAHLGKTQKNKVKTLVRCKGQALTSRSRGPRYAPQMFVHALRALLHKHLLHFTRPLNSSVICTQK